MASHRQTLLCHVRGAEGAMSGLLHLYHHRMAKHTQKLSRCIREA